MKKLFWVSVICLLLSSCISNQEGVDIANEYYNVGNAFFEVDQLQKAEEYYSKTLDIDPNYHRARYNLIHLQIKQLDFKSANKNISYLKEFNGMNLKIEKLDAYIKYNEGNLEESLKIYLNVYNSGDISEDVILNISKLYYQLGFYDESIGYISELLIGEEDKSLYNMAGLISEAAEDFDMATKYYENYISLGGNSFEVLKSLSKIYTNQNDYENLKPILQLLINNSDGEESKADTLFTLAEITLLYDNNFSLGYDYLIDAINAGFSSKDKVDGLLNKPDLIEIDKVRQLFIDNKIIE